MLWLNKTNICGFSRPYYWPTPMSTLSVKVYKPTDFFCWASISHDKYCTLLGGLVVSTPTFGSVRAHHNRNAYGMENNHLWHHQTLVLNHSISQIKEHDMIYRCTWYVYIYISYIYIYIYIIYSYVMLYIYIYSLVPDLTIFGLP